VSLLNRIITRLTPPAPSRAATITPRAPRILAYLFTLASAIWTIYSVWDLLGVGVISITTGAGTEGLWVGGMLAYRARPTRLTATAMLVGLAGTVTILAIHGAHAYHWGGIVAIVPPLAAELFWHVDAQLSADPTDLTPEQQDQVNAVIREARHITARAAADQTLEDAEHAAKLARIRRDGELRQAEDLADYDVALSRINMQRQIARRTPLMLPAVATHDSSEAAEEELYDDAHHDAPQVTGMSTAAAIRSVAEWCGSDAPTDRIVRILARQGVAVTDSHVRSELSRARRKAGPKATFGFGAP
jgi:hypothetical protein